VGRQQLFLEARDSNLEKLVEYLAQDGEEAHPFEEREQRILGQSQHPPREFDLGELAIQVPGGNRTDVWRLRDLNLRLHPGKYMRAPV